MIERLLVELRELSPDSRHRVATELKSKESVLQRMDDDIVDLVMQSLSCDDRIALLCALHRKPTSRVTAACMLSRKVLASALLTAFFAQSLVKGIHDMADKVLFTVPSCFSDTRTFIFADWTPFRKRTPTTLAAVYWSAVAPHARCDLEAATLNTFSREMMDRRAFAVRLTAYIEDYDAELAVKVGKRITTICPTPIQVNLWNIFANVLDWVDVSYMHTCMCTADGQSSKPLSIFSFKNINGE